MCKTDFFKQYRLKLWYQVRTNSTYVLFQMLPFTTTCISANYYSFSSYFQVQRWICMEMYLQPIDRGLTLAKQQTHIVENRFAPGKLFMQTDLWYTKLKLLNCDMQCILISEWECPTVLAESNTPTPPHTFDSQWCTRQHWMLVYVIWHHCLTDPDYDSD